MTDKTTLTVEEADKIIAEKVAAAYALIRECEALAVEHLTSFSFSLSYGMGGWFNGCDDDEVYYNENPEERPEDWSSSFEPGWQSSSSNC